MRLVHTITVSVPLLASLLRLGFAEVNPQSPAPLSAIDTEGNAKELWKSKSERLIDELRLLADAVPDADGQQWRTTETPIEETKADEILWSLWLVTGKPPLLRGDAEPLREFLARNVRSYESYVTAHGDMTCEDINRIGLANAVESFGSPLWIMTLFYLSEKTGLDNAILEVRSTPPRPMVVWPLKSEEYERKATALSKWLDANRGRLQWESSKLRFRSSEGAFLGTEDLFDAANLGNRKGKNTRGSQDRLGMQ